MASLAKKVFKLIILHNKLMSESDLNFYLEDCDDPVQALDRMVASNMFGQDVADKVKAVYLKKYEKEKAKAAGGEAPAATATKAPPKPAAPTPSADDDDDDDEEPIPLPDEDEEVFDMDGSGEIPLDFGGDGDDALNKPDELGWVDTASQSADNESDWREADDDSIQIEMPEEVEHHDIVKGSSGRIGMGKHSEPAAKPGSAKLAASADEAESTDSAAGYPEAEHIESGVAPKQYDPLAVKLLQKAVQLGASDVHLSSGSSPFFRLHGTLAFTDLPALTPDQARAMALGFMDDKQQQQFLHTHDIDFSLDEPNLGRFRVNALEQFRGPAIIFRVIPTKIPTLEQLGLPNSIARYTEYHQGLVLLTGPAGCGKTTTAAALVDLVNESRHDHVITVEDPVEFMHVSKNCNVTQRQVPTHTLSFAAALKAALREDPDVIMIGEMRDLETVSLAIRAAETGHLVIGTLQTKSAARTIDRVIDVFPEDQQAQIRAMLSESLRGIVSQQLVPLKNGKGRVPAIEVLNVVSSVSNLIRDAKTFQLPSLMQTGRKQGQIMMDDSLQALIDADKITKEEAIKVAENPKRFK